MNQFILQSHSPNHRLNKSEFVTDNKVQLAALQTACTNFVFPANEVTPCNCRVYLTWNKCCGLDRFPVPGGPYNSTVQLMNRHCKVVHGMITSFPRTSQPNKNVPVLDRQQNSLQQAIIRITACFRRTHHDITQFRKSFKICRNEWLLICLHFCILICGWQGCLLRG